MTEQPLLQKASLLSPPKPVNHEAIETSVVSKASEILKIDDWRKISQKMLEQALPINPLATHPDEGDLGGEEIGLWLEAVERNQREAWGNLCYLKETTTSNNRRYTQEQFFEQVLQQGKSKSKGHRLAILGASGTGKTTILHKIAFWVLEKTEDIPIWISASDLGKLSLQQYLAEKWLLRVTKPQTLAINELKNSFESLLNSGHLWLLLDGIDELSFEHLSSVSPFLTNSQAQILSPSTVLTQQLQGWTDKARVILTSRSYTWKIDRTTPSDFDIYSPVGLNDVDLVQLFIKKWFFPTVANHYPPLPYWQAERHETTNNSQNLAQSLCNAIEQFGQERIEELVNTPLRLSLLCRLWQQHYPRLPATKASLYQQLVAEFYQWQAEKVTTTTEHQQQLNHKLGQLALQAMQSEANPFRLPHRLVAEVLGEDTLLFRLVIRLGWLKAIGVWVQNRQEKIYAFFDETFQDYFAATAIKDWRFFLPAQPIANYPIFERRWKRIILLWLGREDISTIDKNAFIQALINFDDECGLDNYYGKRAYFLAAAGLAELETGEKTQEIIQQLLQWALIDKTVPKPFVEAAKIALLETHRSSLVSLLIELLPVSDEIIQKEAFKLLEKLGKRNPTVIKTLSQQLEMPELSGSRFRLAESLGKLDPGNGKAIQTLIQGLETATLEEHLQLALSSLEKISQGNPKVITSVVRRLQASQSASTQRRAFECLETIGQGNATAIAALVQLIRTTKEQSLRRQAAESLEKIDPGNPTAIAALIQLLQVTTPEEIRHSAIYSLGEITPGNKEAITALVNLLASSQSVYIYWLAVSSLGKIGIGNLIAIDALVRLIDSTEQVLLRKDAIESLSKIAPGHPVTIAALVELMETTEDESTRCEIAESLSQIDPGNPEAIAVLSHLLHNTSDEFTRRQAAASLGQIDPGNLESVFTLIQLIQSSLNQDIQRLAAESLGEIGAYNPAAVAASIRLIHPRQNSKTLKLAAKSLGKIGGSHRETIATLVKILQFSEDESTRLQAADSLIAILSTQPIKDMVAMLKEILSKSSKKPELATQKVIWYCVQHLSYSDFYSLWHSQPHLSTQIAPSSTLLSKQFNGLEQLRAYLQQQPQLQTVQLVWIDCGEFLDPDNPSVDIYDRMLAQNCPPFEHGIPETFSKLRLYWNTLRRNHPQQTFVWVFYDARQPISPYLWHTLSKFSGLICVVTEQYEQPLPTFSPQTPDLSKAIPQGSRFQRARPMDTKQLLLKYLTSKDGFS